MDWSHSFLFSHLQTLGLHATQHLLLAFVSTTIAIIIGIPTGIFLHKKAHFRGLILSIANIFQTIPSLALMAFLIPVVGIGMRPTLITLTIYALLPIIRNTFIGLMSVPQASIDAARGLGFSRMQRLFKVELPLAMPIILSGVRIATAMTIAITTIAAVIGAGGLGVFITQGLALDDTRLILLGAIPTAILALLLDYILSQLEVALNSRKRSTMLYKKTKATFFIIMMMGFFTLISTYTIHGSTENRKNTIIIGSKNFTEQFILADLIADIIEAKTHLRVIRKLNLSSSAFLHSAMLHGDIDIYPEYTGTAYMTILNETKILSPKATYDYVKNSYQHQFNVTWLAPFGFSNSQTIAIQDGVAKKFSLDNLSQFANISSQLRMAAPAEFISRSDALPNINSHYGIFFKSITSMQPDLMYQAIANNQVDAILVFTTDPRIEKYHLVVLKDDKQTQPDYFAAPIIRSAIIKAHPEVVQALQLLAGRINNKTMQRLNYLVTEKHIPADQVALSFLRSQKLI